MDLMTIGTFAVRTRLSRKALRLYDRLGLVSPTRTDPSSGYRLYSEHQVEAAQVVALLRGLDMPLPVIADVVARPPHEAADAVGRYWAGIEAQTAGRRSLVSYIQARLTGASMTGYDITTREIPERRLVSISRHLHASQADAFFCDAFARLRSAGPGIKGIAGCPFLVFYGEVSEDSDGPLELCRPLGGTADPAGTGPDLQVRVEPTHEEAFIRLAMKDMGWPALAPAADALETWLAEQRRQPAGALRQVLIADQRTATPDTMVCDLTVPLR
jgi:DNA-binding transcriptional MerR regulator